MKTLKVALAIFLLIVAGAAIKVMFQEMRRIHGDHPDVKSAAWLTSVANKVKQEQGVPKMINQDTEWYDIAGQEGVLVYYFRLVKVNANEFDAQQFSARMKPALTERVCSQPEDQGLFILKQGIVMRASYVDKFDAPIASFDLNPGDCDAGRNLSPTDKVRWKPERAQNAQPEQTEQQPEAKPESPWGSQTPSQTPAAKRPHQTVETPEAKVQAFVDDGNSQLEHKNYDAAIKDFQAALALDPGNYAARSGLQEAQHMR